MNRFFQIIVTSCLPFFGWTQNRYDVVIDEIMADPSPQVALPANEWIELKNVTSSPVNLSGWRVADANGQSGPIPNFILQPDSFVIICPASAVPAMSAFGTAIAVSSFPSLDNDGDQIFLRSSTGKTIHALEYSVTWYETELKKEGGWTIEMIDSKSPCTGKSNWKASVDIRGGTPGKKNSVDAVNPDNDPPKLKHAFTIDSTTIIVVYNEPVDSLKAATSGYYTIDGLSIASLQTVSPLFNTVQLKLTAPLLPGKIYNLTVLNVTDCMNNTIGSSNKTKIGLPSEALASDIVINEILFNPRSNGEDYVEFYNRSNKIIDASKLFTANRNSSGSIASIKQISAVPLYIFPGDYRVITINPANLQLNYLVEDEDAVLTLSPLPSFSDDEGTVILLNGQGAIVDEVNYKEDWHFKLINNPEGISLERIDPDGPSEDPANWHSAASTAGYGTPGYKNSQYKQTEASLATIEVLPKVFSPDNDGHDDIATIQYQVTEPGYVANISIFDSEGRIVRSFVKNNLLGLKGSWNWDGLDEKGRKLPVGVYIIYTEIFNLQAKKQHFKNMVVLAGKLQ